MRVQTDRHYIIDLPESRTIEAGETSLYETEAYYRLVLVPAGGHYCYRQRGASLYEAGALMYLVPPGRFCSIKAVHQPLHVVAFHFRAHNALCRGECPRRSRGNREIALEVVGEEPKGYKGRPRRRNIEVTSLPMPSAIEVWRESCAILRRFEATPLWLYDHKLEEFFLLLKMCYSPTEGAEFLRYYHCRIEGFRQKIFQSYHEGMDVAELYALGEAMGLNELAFKRSFVEEFGLPPREWLVEQRAKAIYRALVEGDKPLKELSQDFGFCSVSHFGAFCRQTLGDTPLHIRKGAL